MPFSDDIGSESRIMKAYLLIVAALAFGAAAQQAAAKATAAEAATLSNDLTPVGAQKGPNKDGSIPAWSGGQAKHGKLSGEYPRNDQIDGDKPLFVITHDNYSKYSDKLTEGHKELLKRYADYKMDVYPTRRTASFPDFIYKATALNAV